MDSNRTKKSPRKTVDRTMFRGLLVGLVALTTAGIATARGNFDKSLRFKGGIGVIPVTGVAANVTVTSFFLARIAGRGERWMRNPGGKEFSREHWVCFRKGRRDRRPADKNRLKPACAREEPSPWSPKESPSPPGPGLPAKTGGGQGIKDTHNSLFTLCRWRRNSFNSSTDRNPGGMACPRLRSPRIRTKSGGSSPHSASGRRSPEKKSSADP